MCRCLPSLLNLSNEQHNCSEMMSCSQSHVPYAAIFCDISALFNLEYIKEGTTMTRNKQPEDRGRTSAAQTQCQRVLKVAEAGVWVFKKG